MKRKNNNKSKEEHSIKAIVRVRPTLAHELETQPVVTVSADGKSVNIQVDDYNQMETKFDAAFSHHRTQKELFTVIQPAVNSIMGGFNATVFAYGQTGSGKTYTMFGKSWESNFQEVSKIKKRRQKSTLTNIEGDEDNAGLILRSTSHIFHKFQEQPGLYSAYCSFIQVYNQKIYDLLENSPKPTPLSIHQSKQEGIFVEGLGQFQIDSYEDCVELISRGEKNRHIRQTSMNTNSSRSHTIFQLIVQSTQSNQKGQYMRARLNLCDLAGSQKINKRQHLEVEHLQEVKNINLSLTALGKVIHMLSKQKNSKITSLFRQSKLTRLLQESLVGSTNTYIIGAISPSSKCLEQTLNTLKFVERAQHIKLTVKPSAISNQSSEVVNKMHIEMEHIRRLIKEKQKVKVPKEVQARLSKLESENQNLRQQRNRKKQNFESLVQENRRIREAIVRMERVAMDNYSDGLTLSSYSDEEEIKKKKQQKKKKVKMLEEEDELQESKLPSINTKRMSAYQDIYSVNDNDSDEESPKLKSRLRKNPQKLQEIEPIAQEFEKSFISKGRATSQLGNLEKIQNDQQEKYLHDLNTIQKSQKRQRNRLHQSLDMREKETRRNPFLAKPRKKLDYSQRIKELEAQLKK